MSTKHSLGVKMGRYFSTMVAVGVTALSTIASADSIPFSAPKPFSDYFYVGVHAGAANIHGSRLMQFDNISKVSPKQNSFMVGGEVGYEFMNHLAAEFGGSWINPVKLNTATGDARLNTWLGYLAARLSAPVINHINLFMKAGLGFQYQQSRVIFSDNAKALGADRSAWMPVFAVGARYDVNHRWQTSIQYMRFASNFHHNSDGSSKPGDRTITEAAFFTPKDLVSLGVSYKFRM